MVTKVQMVVVELVRTWNIFLVLWVVLHHQRVACLVVLDLVVEFQVVMVVFVIAVVLRLSVSILLVEMEMLEGLVEELV